MKFDLARFVKETRSDAQERATPLGTSLYVLECPGHIKIGVSGDPEQRAAELQVGNPHRLRVALRHRFQSRSAAYLAERGAHMFLAERAAAGEWFRATPAEAADLLERIAYHAEALVRVRIAAANRCDAAYASRYDSDPAFRASEDAHRAKWSRIANDKRRNREWRKRRAA